MAKHPHQVIQTARTSSARVLGEFEIAIDGTLEKFRLETEIAPVASVTLDIRLNGATVYALPGDRPVLLGGTDEITDVTLAVAVVEGDRLEILAVAPFPPFGFFGPRTYMQVVVEDHLPTYYGGTSDSSLAISVGSKAVTVNEDGLAYSVGSPIKLTSEADPLVDYMTGVVTVVAGLVLTVVVDSIAGTGTHTDWSLSLAGLTGATGATGAAGPPLPPEADATIVTASLADTAVEEDTVTLGKVSIIARIEADRACRVRLYNTAAARTADAARAVGVDPTVAGLIAECVFAGAGTALAREAAIAYDCEAVRTGDIPYSIQNLSGSASTVTVTIPRLVLEV